MTTVSRALVKAKIARVFPARAETDILVLLDRYGADAGERERDRVHLAVLKLCEEEGRSDPTAYIEAAKRDYRDVLAWAESPNLMRRPASSDAIERQRLEALDRKQYDDWLAT